MAETRIFDALDREWHDLTRRPRWQATYRQLAHDSGLETYGSADELVAQLHGLCQDHDDRILHALLTARPSPIAMRVLVRAFTPTFRSIARRLTAEELDRTEREAVTLAAGWERLATYPLERRPARIAANITLDTRRTAHRAASALTLDLCGESVEVIEKLADQSTATSADESLIGAAVAAVSDGDLSGVEASAVLNVALGRSIAALARPCDQPVPAKRRAARTNADVIRERLP